MSLIPTSPSMRSPAKRRFDATHLSPTSPGSPSKRTRMSSDEHLKVKGNGSNVLYAFTAGGEGDEDSLTSKVIPLPESSLPLCSTDSLHSSYAAVDDETYTTRKEVREAMKSGKGTEIAYPRHVKNYETFMLTDQAMRKAKDPNWYIIPPFPITARNVALFLNYERTRIKKNTDGRPLPGTRLSFETIKQTITALENWRHTHENDYKDNPDALRPLRDDSRIRTHEAGARATESQRNAEAQTLKALGTTADTFTVDEVIRCSMWAFRFKGTNQQVHLGLRDRAMLLLATATAFRGDNTRSLQFSDLFHQVVPLYEIGPDVTTLALVLFSDQGKTNTTGRIDEQAALRHRIVEICPIAGLGFYLFSYFHILGRECPDFAPDFSVNGEIGFRRWYKMILFPGSGGDDKEMTYDNHNKRCHLMYNQNDIKTRKITHAGRPFAATECRKHGATTEGIKAQGIWSQGPLRACYERTLPVDALLAAAFFNGKKQESYYVSRETLTPPTALSSGIFPWVEEQEEAYKNRCEEHGKKATDVALSRFLALLKWLRIVILQDAAILWSRSPDCSIFRFAPFNTPEFVSFAGLAAVFIQQAELEAQQQLNNLPETMATSFRGILTSQNVQYESIQDNVRFGNAQVNARLDSLETLVRAQHIQQSNSKRRKITLSLQDGTTVTSAPSQTLVTVAGPPLPPVNHIPPLNTLDSQPTLPTPTSQIVTAAGNIFDSTTFHLSTTAFEREKQLASISKLEALYPASKLALHQFEWILSTSESQEDEYLPIYTYWRPSGKSLGPSIAEIWREWSEGMDGHLSVMQLTATWAARWRRNNSAAKTEACRRKKVISLIEALMNRQSWNAEQALQYLASKYPIPTPSVPHLKNTRAFIDCLQKKDSSLFGEIVDRAALAD